MSLFLTMQMRQEIKLGFLMMEDNQAQKYRITGELEQLTCLQVPFML